MVYGAHKMSISVTDTGFFDFIAHRYARLRPPHPEFPSLVFLYNYALHNTLLQHLLLKNMNILAGSRDYRLHQHQHLHFVVNLFLRISPPCPVPAAPAVIEKIRLLSETTNLSLLSQSVTDRFYQAAFPQLYTLDHRSRLPGPGAAAAYPGKSLQYAAAEFYPTPLVFPEISHTGDVYQYREPRHTAAKQEIIPGPPAWGIQSSRTLNMVINENRELLKKIRTAANRYYISRERHTQTLMVKQTDSLVKPVGDVLFTQTFESSQPGTTESYPTLPDFNGASHMSHVHGIPGEAKPAAGEKLETVPGPPISETGNDKSKFPGVSTTLNKLIETNPVFTREIRLTSKTSHPAIFQQSLTSPVMNNITRKETSIPGDIHRFSPTAPVPDLYYSSPMKGMGSDVEESRAVTGPIKGVKSLEESALAPAKIFGQEQAGVSKKPAVDLDQLTDQVFRKLERKIIIEKERRGW
jgi:hypothetical protein